MACVLESHTAEEGDGYEAGAGADGTFPSGIEADDLIVLFQ